MTSETRMLVQYRLDRAREALAEASLLLDSGHANTGVNRLYYACFYAVSALLLTKGVTATRHSGLRTLFHQHLIRPGLWPLGRGQLYDRLFDQRQRSNYTVSNERLYRGCPPCDVECLHEVGQAWQGLPHRGRRVLDDGTHGL